MEAIKFDTAMLKTRQIILWCTLGLIVLALAGALMLALGDKPLYTAVEVLAAIGLVGFLLALAFLGLVYLRQPEVKKKRQWTKQMGKLTQEVEKVQASLAQALQGAETARQVAQAEQSALRQTFEGRSRDIEEKISGLASSKDQALAAALAGVQAEYIERGLKANTLDPADIPGIGEVLIQKLNEAGIHTAWDITNEAVQAIAGFGESKALTLVRWREIGERNLVDNQPKALAEGKQREIEEAFVSQIRDLQGTQESLKSDLEKSLEELRAKEAQSHAAAISQETSARQSLVTLEMEKREAEGQAAQHKQITFFKLLSTALIKIPPGTWQQRLLAFLAALAFLAGGVANLVILIAALIKARVI